MRTPLSKVAKSVAVAAVVALGITAGSVTGASAAMMRSIPPNPVFLTPSVCGNSVANDSAYCNATILRALNNARGQLGMQALGGSFSLGAFDNLSIDEQIFAIADIERTDAGLAPIGGLTAQLNSIALSAAYGQTDPSTNLPLQLSGGGYATNYGSNFAEGTANPMGADYFWMYDDGLGSPNANCTPRNESGCWGHRYNILGYYNDPSYCPAGSEINTVMGAAEVPSGAYSPSITEIFTNDCGAPPAMEFTWSDVQRDVFGVTAPSPPPVAPSPPPVASSPPPVASSPAPVASSPAAASPTPSTRHTSRPRARSDARDLRTNLLAGTVAGSVKARA